MNTNRAFEVVAAQGANACAEFTRSLAVVIGINDYGNGVPRLATPVNDATQLAHLLASEHGYDVCLVVADATKARLTALFHEDLPTLVGPNDRLLLYFAGHGIALDGEDGPQGFLIPQDAHPEDRSTFLAMTDVHDQLINLPCRHLLAIFDCCFAGAFRWSATRNLRVAMPEILHKERYDRFIRDPAWQVITSAAYDQRALDILAGNVVGKRDAPAGQNGAHSPFAMALFAALNGAGDLLPKGVGDGVITAAELYLYLRDYVELGAEAQAGHYQTPGIWPLRRHGKGEYIFLVPGHFPDLPPAPPLTAKHNPYRGLQPYDEEHAELFFGRNALIKQLATLVQAQPLTVVLGASGTGKSSLVKAGLVPYVKQHGEQPEFHVLTPIRPGDMPLRLLADQLASELNDGVAIQPTPAAIAPIIEQWLTSHPDTDLLLIIDQFEELITLCRDPRECGQFLDLLADLVQQHGDRLRIVLTLRTDFEPQFTDSPLAHYWHRSERKVRFVVPPLTQAELRQVIEEPAAQRVLFFDPAALVDQLVDEVSQTPGALPLLSFTLSELYLKYLKRQEEAQRVGETIERSLTEADYRALGGVIGSLRTRADEVYGGLDTAHQQTMQSVMLRMVAIEGGELARRRVLATELEYEEAEENQRVATVINQMVEARLLVYGGGADIDGDNRLDNYIEPAHDALVRAWDKLLVWKQAADEYLPLQRRLTRAAQEWRLAPAEDKTGLLWDNDPGLPQVLPDIIKQADLLGSTLNPGQSIWPSLLVERAPQWLNKLEDEFIAASVRQRATLRRRLTLITAAVFLGLLGLTIYAFVQNNFAQRSAAESKSAALASNAQQAIQDYDHDLAIALALKANTISNPPELAVNALAAAAYVPGTVAFFDGHTDRITDVALSPDGRTALSASMDKRVLLWDVGTRAILHQLDAQQVISVTQVAYSPSGDTALLGSADGSISVWELATGTIRQRLTADHAAQITALAYSADGQTALSGDSDGALILWDVASGTMTRSLATHPNGVSAVALSPDGRTALSGGYDANVMLWNLADGELLRSIEVFGGRILTVAYDPTNRYIIAGSTDYTVRAWSLATWQIVGRVDLSAHTQNIVSIAIAPDGITVASSASDGSIRLWDLQVNAPIGTLVAHRAPVISLAFSGDSRSLLSGSRDNTVRLWDVHGPTQIRHYPIEPRLTGGGPLIDTTNNLAIDATQHLALSGARGVALLWNYDTGEEARRFPLNSTPELVRNGLVFQVKAYDSTVGNQDGDGIANVELSILDATGQTVYTHEEKFAVYCAFGGDTQACDAWDFARADYRWPSNNEQPGDPIHSGLYTLRAVIHAEDGKSEMIERTLMIQLPDSTITSPLLTTVDVPPSNASTPASSALVAQISQAGTRTTLISAVALHPDGEHALVSDGSQLIAWNLATDEKMLLPRGHRYLIFNIVYTQDGHTALSTDEGGVVIAWNGETGQQLWRRPLTRNATLWNVAFTGDGQRALAGYEDHSVILWDLASGEEIQHFTGHQDAIYWVAISPDESKALTGAADRSVILWDLASGQEIRRFEGHSLPVRTVAFSPDGRTLLSGGEDQTVRLWNSETGAEIFQFEGHTSPIQNVLFLPGGSQILSRAKDGELILWGLPPLDSTALQNWTYANRYVRDLTCDEQLLYQMATTCQPPN